MNNAATTSPTHDVLSRDTGEIGDPSSAVSIDSFGLAQSMIAFRFGANEMALRQRAQAEGPEMVSLRDAEVISTSTRKPEGAQAVNAHATTRCQRTGPALALAAMVGLAAMIGVPAAKAQDAAAYPSVTSASAGNSYRVFYSLADRLTADTRQRVAHRLGLPYGPEPRQRLDLYLPAAPCIDQRVLIYVHGGNFVEGDREHYGYVARDYIANGVTVVVPSYRLTRDGHSYPAQIEDLAQVLTWVRGSLSCGEDKVPQIVIAGHSVGALMAASLGLDRRWMGNDPWLREALRGVVLISGHFRPDPAIAQAYAPTPASMAAAAIADHVSDPVARVVIAYGSNETARALSADELDKVLRAEGIVPQTYALPAGNHSDTALDFSLPDSPLFALTLASFDHGADAPKTPPSNTP